MTQTRIATRLTKWICQGEGSIYLYPFTATLGHIGLIDKLTDRLTVNRVGRLICTLIDGLPDGLWIGSGWALDGL
jgi:hypothetical protein